MIYKEKPILRFEFVGMLFALAIGQVAVEFVGIYKSHLSFWEWYYSLSHLVLATFVIAMSWIGWQSSKSIGNTVTITSIFSLPFIVLLIDIGLVILYYLIANTNEKFIVPKKSFESPNAVSELFLIWIIFLIYLIWDIITKLVSIKYKKQQEKNTFTKIYKIDLNSLLRIFITLFCFILSTYFYIVYKDSELTGIQVLIIDINLLLLFIFFRGCKQTFRQKYNLNESQIPNSIIDESEIDFTQQTEITILDSKRRKLKLFLFRWLPLILIFILEIINHFKL